MLLLAPFFCTFLKSLIFAWIPLSGFSIHREYISLFLCAPNFCLDCPFRFSAHRNAHFLPKPPFRVFNLASCSLFFFYIERIKIDMLICKLLKEMSFVIGMQTSQRDVICCWMQTSQRDVICSWISFPKRVWASSFTGEREKKHTSLLKISTCWR